MAAEEIYPDCQGVTYEPDKKVYTLRACHILKPSPSCEVSWLLKREKVATESLSTDGLIVSSDPKMSMLAEDRFHLIQRINKLFMQTISYIDLTNIDR